MKSIILLIMATPLWLASAVTAKALPLQPGLYSMGSKYIQIARNGDRWCFQGFSARATSISSLSPDPKNPSLYRLHGTADAVVRQERPDQLAYGSTENLLPYSVNRQIGSDLSTEMKQCLNTSRPYHKMIRSTR